MKKTKTITNEEIFKKLEEIEKLTEKNLTPVSYLIQPFHSHCICDGYNRRVVPPYNYGGIQISTSAGTNTLITNGSTMVVGGSNGAC